MEIFDSLVKTLDLAPIDIPMIGLCAILFLWLWKTLDRILLRPYLEFYEQRESRTTGAHAAIGEKARQLEMLKVDYERRLTEARISAVSEKLTVLNSAKKCANELIEGAQAEAKSSLDAARKELKVDIERLRADSLSHASAMADDIVRKLTSSTGSAPKASDHRLN